MTVVIISREAFSKNIKIGVIKSLKLMSFKCKKNYENVAVQDRHFEMNLIHHLICYYYNIFRQQNPTVD